MKMSQEQVIGWSRYGMVPCDWIVPGKILASIYPPDLEYLEFLNRCEGIGVSINLSEAPWPAGWSEGSGIMCHHIPVVDMSVPTRDQVREAIGIISSNDGPVMVHCAAGIGRTGTLLALYLVNEGMSPSEAIALVRGRRSGSIQTLQQERMIYEWKAESGR
ncbi:MAG: dual specificity protein phosphatase family protein [Candidatus Thermoplasmatota archaeon]|nr:dual specificity protein phosphatase family protein [Candidatus Thermoplasmatota archaeon]